MTSLPSWDSPHYQKLWEDPSCFWPLYLVLRSNSCLSLISSLNLEVGRRVESQVELEGWYRAERRLLRNRWKERWTIWSQKIVCITSIHLKGALGVMSIGSSSLSQCWSWLSRLPCLSFSPPMPQMRGQIPTEISSLIIPQPNSKTHQLIHHPHSLQEIPPPAMHCYRCRRLNHCHFHYLVLPSLIELTLM